MGISKKEKLLIQLAESTSYEQIKITYREHKTYVAYNNILKQITGQSNYLYHVNNNSYNPNDKTIKVFIKSSDFACLEITYENYRKHLNSGHTGMFFGVADAYDPAEKTILIYLHKDYLNFYDEEQKIVKFPKMDKKEYLEKKYKNKEIQKKQMGKSKTKKLKEKIEKQNVEQNKTEYKKQFENQNNFDLNSLYENNEDFDVI